MRRYLTYYHTALGPTRTSGAGNPVVFWERGTGSEDSQVRIPTESAAQAGLGAGSVADLPNYAGCFSAVLYYPVRQAGFLLTVPAGGA
jgi:hypothetical protein